MRLEKRILRSRAFLSIARGVLKGYRWMSFGTFLWVHDERLQRFLRSNEPAIFAAWHQDLAFSIGYVSRFNSRRKTYALASASRDGGIAATAAEAVGYQRPIRGSTTHGGRRALLAMVRLLRAEPDASMAVVCDGPRPPARDLKPGILHLARATGRPIWLVRTSFNRRYVFEKSWAKFHWPKLGARCVVRADGPITIARDTTRAELDVIRLDLQARLNRLAEEADEAALRLR